jgi:hypothetical protein
VTHVRLRTPLICLALAGAALAQAPCFADTAGGRCTLLMGGGGTATKDLDTNARWVTLSSDLSHAVGSALASRGYHLSDFIVYLPDPEQRAKALEQTIYKTGCGKMLQITYDLSGASGAPASGFVVSVSRFEQTAASRTARSVGIIEEYNVEYEYIPTKPKPTLGELAQSVADDLAKAGVLAK